MRNLIIIGNGFDLAHGLDTDYKSFIADIKRDPKKYGLKELSDNVFLFHLTCVCSVNANWSDIECFYFNLLIDIDDKARLREKFEVQINFHPRYNVSRLNRDFQQVKGFLARYLHKQEAKFERNENYGELFNLFNNELSETEDDSIVLNFNYTNSVRKYIDDYSHFKYINIHGELDDDKTSKENPMIFGYAADDAESKKLLAKNDSHFVRNIKKFNYLLTRNESRLKKVIDESTRFNVYVLGHSCGLSDKLILNQIFNSEKVHKIYPFYYAGKHGNSGMDGYFETMVNIDRIIDDYSKEENKEKAFQKLVLYHECIAMPQREKVEGLKEFLIKTGGTLQAELDEAFRKMENEEGYVKSLVPKVNK